MALCHMAVTYAVTVVVVSGTTFVVVMKRVAEVRAVVLEQ